jgi:hypothetical protein
MSTVLCLGLCLFAVDAFADGQPAPVQRSHPTDARAWRKITLGVINNVEAYRNALQKAAIKVGDHADEILGRPGFPYARAPVVQELILVSAAELILQAQFARLSDIYKRARDIGFELCPGEVGPQLRLDYRDQPLGDVLHIAMVPLATYQGELTTLAVANFDGTLSLVGNDGRPDFRVPKQFRFVFGLRAKHRPEMAERP